MRTNQDKLELFYLESLEKNIIKEIARMQRLDLRAAMEIYYRSELSKQIAKGMYGIQYLDAKYLADDLLDNEKELLKPYF